MPSIPLFDIISVVVPEPKSFVCIPASATELLLLILMELKQF